MHRHPTTGIANTKPRLSGDNGKAKKSELSKLNREYLKTRNRQQAARAAVAEIALQERRGELISRKLALSQLAYLLSIFRQRTLLAPAAIARQLVSLNLVDQDRKVAVMKAIQADICELLTDLSDLPLKVTDPDWLDKIDADAAFDQGQSSGERFESPRQLKLKEARAKRRRIQKTETVRKLRAKERGEDA